MARTTRRRYQKSIVACEDALTTSRNLNVAGLSSAITLANELRTDYAAPLSISTSSAEANTGSASSAQRRSRKRFFMVNLLVRRIRRALRAWAWLSVQA